MEGREGVGDGGGGLGYILFSQCLHQVGSASPFSSLKPQEGLYLAFESAMHRYRYLMGAVKVYVIVIVPSAKDLYTEKNIITISPIDILKPNSAS